MNVNDFVSFTHIYLRVPQLENGKSGTKRERREISGRGCIIKVYKNHLKVDAGGYLGNVAVPKGCATLVEVQSTIDDELAL